jgi:dissimilatory sulfite reductase (desulfoviridin) alpha/beta subunit
MAGKTPRWADRLPFVVKNRKVLWKLLGTIIDWYDKHGNPKERFGTTIERVGLKRLLDDIGILS